MDASKLHVMDRVLDGTLSKNTDKGLQPEQEIWKGLVPNYHITVLDVKQIRWMRLREECNFFDLCM